MKILLSPSSFGQVGNEPIELLTKNGFEIINNPYGRKLTEDEVIILAKECTGIVAGVEPLNRKVMDALPNLKCISRVGVGMDSIDLDYAKKKGIIVRNTPDGPTRSVAELTIGLTFALLRKIYIADANIKSGIWKKEIGNLVYGKKIGIVGLGRIGKLVAEMFSIFHTEIMAFDLKPDKTWAEANNVSLVDKDILFKCSDIVTLHLPGSTDNKPIIGDRELSFMKRDSYLINVSRGGVVDETKLIELLKEKKIKGAALDVFSEEPYKGEFTKLNNVLLTPHLGSYASEAKLKMETDAVLNLINVLDL